MQSLRRPAAAAAVLRATRATGNQWTRTLSSSSASSSASSASEDSRPAAAAARAHFQAQLDAIRAAGTFKEERILASKQAASVVTQDGKQSVLNFCANNYLGLADSPELVQASVEAMESRGHQWLFYRPGKMLKPDDIQTFLAQAEQLLALLSGDAQR